MAYKFVILVSLAAIASAIELDSYQHYQPTLIKKVIHEEHDAPAHYDFSYSVHDEHTGDIKSQQESRHEDKVQGVYTLVEPDGHRRIVHYSADDHSGFEAKVDREYIGAQHTPQQIKYVQAAPQVHKIIQAPSVTYSAPLSHGLSSNYHQ